MKWKIGECDHCHNGVGSPGVRLTWVNFVKGQPCHWLCPWCYHIAQTSKRYGLDWQEYEAKLSEAKNCDCCGKQLEGAYQSGVGRGIGRFADSPSTGTLRGVLCWNCYATVRYLKGRQENALRTYNYLQLRNFQLEGGMK